MAESVEFWFMLLMFGLDLVSIIELASMKMPMGAGGGGCPFVHGICDSLVNGISSIDE